MKSTKRQIVLFDYIRIVFFILIFLRHAMTMGGCNYHVFNDSILNYTGPVMTGFFIMSGFVMLHTYCERKILTENELKLFYVKRFAGIFPVYFLIMVIDSIIKHGQLSTIVKLFPVELI